MPMMIASPWLMAVSIDPTTRAVRNAFFGVPSPNMSWLSGSAGEKLTSSVLVMVIPLFQVRNSYPVCLDHIEPVRGLLAHALANLMAEND